MKLQKTKGRSAKMSYELNINKKNIIDLIHYHQE